MQRIKRESDGLAAQRFTNILLFSGMMMAGCGEAVDPHVLRIREQFLTEKPSGSEQPVANIRKALQSGDLKPDTLFTIRVRINAGEVSSFSDGVARFFVTDATLSAPRSRPSMTRVHGRALHGCDRDRTKIRQIVASQRHCTHCRPTVKV